MSKHSSKGTSWNKLRLQALERDAYTCAYCGDEATEADHITPKSLGGHDALDNLVAACKTCNGAKGARTLVRRAYFNDKYFDMAHKDMAHKDMAHKDMVL